MGSFSILLVKAAALAGGAILGALLARWCDEMLAAQAQARSEYDRTRYEQGLAPIAPQPRTEDSAI
ncbi:MAG TPA: hypothetical protein VKV37_02270 [Ktedonobacteraceae bacterium]|nr:hypothetical protein [Ktedonobacteraceae bacterium]